MLTYSLFDLFYTYVVGSFHWVCRDTSVCNGAVDGIDDQFTDLVHSTPIVAGTCRPLLVSLSVCKGLI